MSENIDAGQNPVTPKSTWWRKIVKRLRPTTITPPIESHVPRVADMVAEHPVISEQTLVQPTKAMLAPEIVALEDPQSIMQEDIQLSQAEDQSVLKSAHRIFFHTTPTQNIASIKETGLIGKANWDMVGRDLGYSLTFAEEFNIPHVRRIMAEKSPVIDFSLIIWKSSADIKRAKQHGSKFDNHRFGPAGELTSDEIIPQGYHNSVGGGGYGGNVEKAELRKIDPSNFLAAIPVTERIQVGLTRSKIEFAYNLSDANSIEKRLEQLLANPDCQVQLTAGYTTADLAHDLMARIQQEVLVHRTKVIARQVLQHIQNSQPSEDYSRDDTDMQEILMKVVNVNEPVSQKYVRAWETRLKQAYQAKGFTWPQLQKMDEDQKLWLASGSDINIYDLWGGNDGCKLFRQTLHSMGFTDLV